MLHGALPRSGPVRRLRVHPGADRRSKRAGSVEDVGEDVVCDTGQRDSDARHYCRKTPRGLKLTGNWSATTARWNEEAGNRVFPVRYGLALVAGTKRRPRTPDGDPMFRFDLRLVITCR